MHARVLERGRAMLLLLRYKGAMTKFAIPTADLQKTTRATRRLAMSADEKENPVRAA